MSRSSPQMKLSCDVIWNAENQNTGYRAAGMRSAKPFEAAAEERMDSAHSAPSVDAMKHMKQG